VIHVGYFADGLGVAEAIKFHLDRLEMDDEMTEADLADARRNPKYRTVDWWHHNWREAHLGPRTGAGVIHV